MAVINVITFTIVSSNVVLNTESLKKDMAFKSIILVCIVRIILPS